MTWLYGALGGAVVGMAAFWLAEATRKAAEHAADGKFRAMDARIKQIEAELSDLRRQK